MEGSYTDQGDFLDDDATQPMMQDPYASVFFSKDRVERLVEPVPENLTADVPIPPGHAHLASNSSKTINVKVLGRGEWMSGCPEGSKCPPVRQNVLTAGEQSFLFQIYNSLAEGSMPCAGGCGHQFKRAPEHFFSLLVGYSDVQELTVAYLPSVRGTPCEYHREQVSNVRPRYLLCVWGNDHCYYVWRKGKDEGGWLGDHRRAVPLPDYSGSFALGTSADSRPSSSVLGCK